MATEYGVFNAEGCLERQIYDQGQANDQATLERGRGDETAYASEMCSDHAYNEQPKDWCEDCASDEGDDDDD